MLYAAAAYLVVSLWIQLAALVAPEPSLLLPLPGKGAQVGFRIDQNMTLAVIAGNATRLLHDPLDVLRVGQCFPVVGAYVLGEHMLGISLLTAPFLALGLDPAVALNLALVTTRVIAGLGMFLLARRLLDDSIAAFVAGFLFAFGYARVFDVVHPFVWGDQWTPFAMLLVDRLLTRPRASWLDAAGLSLSVTLMVGESFYALLAGAIVGGIYFAFVAWRARERLRGRLVLLLAAAILPIVVGGVVLLPYLSSGELINVDAGYRVPFGAFYLLPGQRFFPGALLLVLAGIGAVAPRRLVLPAARLDPRPALVIAAAVIVICAVDSLPIPGTPWAIASPLLLARDWLPGLSAVRAPFCILSGLYLCLALLAAFGVRALARGLAPPARVLAAAALALAWLAETHLSAPATWSFGAPIDLQPHPYALAPEDRSVVAAIAGPVVDFPGGKRQSWGDSFVLAAHHRQPFASCYSSRGPAIRDSMESLLGRLPNDAALEALSLLGFEYLVVHRHQLVPDEMPVLAALEASPRLEQVARSDDHVLFRLRRSETEPTGWEGIFRSPLQCDVRLTEDGEARVAITLTNRSQRIFRHPEPIRRVALDVRWRDARGNTVLESRESFILPLVLEPGLAERIAPALQTPRLPGAYTLELALPGAEPQVLGSCAVERPTPPASGT